MFLFLHSCHWSVERAKEAVDCFYTIKTHSPEIFANRDPASAEIQDGVKVCLYCVLPRGTPEGYRVIYCKIVDPDPSKYVQSLQVNLFDMAAMLDLRLEGAAEGHVIVVDMINVVFGHLAR